MTSILSQLRGLSTHQLLLLTLLPALLLGLAGCGKDDPPPPATPANTTASIAGQVRVPDGIEAHSIMVFAEGTSFMALTDSQGRFEVSGLRPGTYVLRAARPDLVSVAMDPVEITAPDLAKVQPFLTLPPIDIDPIDPMAVGALAQFASRTRGTVRGQVTTQMTGDEVGIEVLIEQTGQRTRTLEDGSFEIINVEPGSYILRVTRPAYADASVTMTIEAGEVTNVPPIRLLSAASSLSDEGLETATADRVIFGSIELLTADGSVPTDFSAVRVVLEGTAFSATPDPRGRFEIRNLPPGNYSVAANAAGFILERKVPVSLRSMAIAEVELTLLEDTTLDGDGGSIVGRVVFDMPPAGSSAGVAVSVAGTSLVGYTDSDGFFSILSVPPGPRELTATMLGYKPGRARAQVGRGPQPTVVEDIRLERDIQRPVLVYTNPQGGATDVTILHPTQITIQFNMPMDTRSVQDAIRFVPEVGYRLTAQGGGPGVGSAVYRLDLDAVPSGNGPVLKYGTRYRLTVVRTASNLEGIGMERDFSMEFTTGFAEIVSTRPADGATDVLLRFDNPLEFHFNAAIDQRSISIDDIEIRPALPAGKGQIYFRRDPRTGWTIMSFAGVGDWNTRYTVNLRRGATTLGGDRVRNLPYRFTFTTNRPVTFEERQGLGDPGFDEAARERARRP